MVDIYNGTGRHEASKILNKGFSYLEMLIVVTIVGIVASVTIPILSSTDSKKLAVATNEVALALQFARDEATRLNTPIGFELKSTEQRFRLFQADTSTSPWTSKFDVYDPLSKKLYDIQLNDSKAGKLSIDLISKSTIYESSCNTPYVFYFDRHGSVWCADPDGVAVMEMKISLTLAKLSKLIKLDGLTGRVSIE